MVEAIEDLFIPVLVYNNKPEDEATLKSFEEPSWNNPVVRFLNPELRDVIPRRDGIWDSKGLLHRLVEALEVVDQKPPGYLKIIAGDLSSAPGDKSTSEQATFAMHCYWVGEARLGGIEGVLRTESGWVNGLEVVNVEFDPARVSFRELAEKAMSLECASRVFARNDAQFRAASELGETEVEILPPGTVPEPAKPSDQKYYLQNSKYAKIELCELQKLKINALLGKTKVDDNEIRQWLSPRQIEAVRQFR